MFSDILSPPRAHGGPAGRARLRASPEDFVVREWLGFPPDGAGDHWLLRVRKRGANTLWVAKQLARVAKIHPRDVGFAGLKDRDAVAEQAFTVPVRSAMGSDWVGVAAEGFEVVAAERHRRKLKRGALRGNDFEIVLRDFEGDRAMLEERLNAIRAGGAPGYFGPQRFGRAARNLDLAVAWFGGGAAPDRVERNFALSAARSAIFNAVLAERVRQAAWNRLQSGDVANLDGSGSIFPVDALDESLRDRCERLDIHPTGPMWGAGSPGSAGAVAQLEQRTADRFPALAAGLSQAGLESERRALRIRVQDLTWSFADSDVRLSYRLPRGAFATAVLHELIEGVFESGAPEGDE